MPRTITSSLVGNSLNLLLLNFIFLLFIIHLIFNLERVLYVNEIFSFLSITLYLKHLPYFLRARNNTFLFLINFLIIYCFLQALAGLFLTSYLYGYYRTLVLFYSIFCFFLGTEFIKNYKQLLFLKLLDVIALPLALLLLCFKSTLIAPIDTCALIPFLFRRYRHSFALMVIWFLLYIVLGVNLTIYVMFAFLLMGHFIFKHNYFAKLFSRPFFIISAIIAFYFSVCVAYFYFNSFYTLGFGHQGYKVMPSFINNNTTWRLMFWAYELVVQLPSHLFFGIGFGTPIFDIHDPQTWFIHTNILFNNTKSFPYALGTHNFLIDILVRLGIIGLIPIIGIYLYIFKRIHSYRPTQLTKCCFFSFMFITAGALCNVVVITPLYASIYWICMGMLYQSLRQDEKDEKNQSYVSHANAAA